jgi:hypothetical protein
VLSTSPSRRRAVETSLVAARSLSIGPSPEKVAIGLRTEFLRGGGGPVMRLCAGSGGGGPVRGRVSATDETEDGGGDSVGQPPGVAPENVRVRRRRSDELGEEERGATVDPKSAG